MADPVIVAVRESMVALGAAGRAMADDAEALQPDLDPQLQTIYGQVEMRFAITTPDPARFGG